MLVYGMKVCGTIRLMLDSLLQLIFHQLKKMCMPLLPWINAGANILGNVWNLLSQGKANRDARNYAQQMYERQRADSLADFNMQWNLEKEYNSPAAMMARYKSAGLNPNLIYGSNQTYNPPAVRSAQAEAWKPTPPQLGDIGSPFMGIYDARLKEAQTDNVKKATMVAEMEAMLKQIQGQNLIADTALKNVNAAKTAGIDTDVAKNSLAQAQALFPASLEMMESNIAKVKAETLSTEVGTKVNLDRNEREIAMNNMNLRTGEMNLKKSAEEILNYRMSRTKDTGELMQLGLKMKQLNQEIDSKALDLRLQKMGIKGNYGDLIRILGMWISSPGGKSLADFVRDAFSGAGKQGPTPMQK